MTLQSDLQDAVARVRSDSQTLHDIVHGDDETLVETEGGPVKTVAKAIKDINDTIEQGLNDLGASGEQLAEAVAATEGFRDEAAELVEEAVVIANALHLPVDLTGKAGKLLAVKEDESGFDVIESKGVFYGLRKNGAKLEAVSGEGTFVAKDFPVWFITLPGVDFSIDPNGHLHINI